MKLADVSIRRPVFATVVIGTFVVLGIFAYRNVGIDLFPSVDFPVVTVTAIYPGADPENVETKVVEKIEDAVATLDGIRRLRSTCAENVGLVVIEFELHRKADQAAQDVRDRISRILHDLPDDVDPPAVEKFDIGAAPVVVAALSGDVPIRELTYLAEHTVRDRLQSVRGVGGVEVVGGREREIKVWIDPLKLQAHRLAVDDVIKALRAQNLDVPAGVLREDGHQYVLKTLGEVHDPRAVGDIVITAMAGAPIRVRDVARVEDGEEEAFSHATHDGRPAVVLVVRKQAGTNTVAIARRIREEVKRIDASLPRGVHLGIPIDNAVFIEHSIADVQVDLALAAVLAVLIIWVFLYDWRATIITALAIPTSVVATFAFLDAMGFTLNNMTMLALTLSVGILVDDAIVVIENIHRHIEMGQRPLRAASDGVTEIGFAVVATTATLLAVFIPVAFMKGIVGRFFLQFGLTVAFAIGMSMLVSFTITPAYAARLLRPARVRSAWGVLARALDAGFRALEHVYRRLLSAALRHRLLTLVAATGFVAAAAWVAPRVPFEFLPEEDKARFDVHMELPVGTPLERTREVAAQVEARIREIPGVKTTLVTVAGDRQHRSNRALVEVVLVPKNQRRYSQRQAMEFVRRVLSTGFPDLTVAVERIPEVGQAGPFRQAAIQFNIRGTNYDELRKAARAVASELRKTPGFVDVDTTYRGGNPELQLDIDRDRAAALGVPIAAVAMALRMYFEGHQAGELSMDGRRVPIRVQLPESWRQHRDAIQALAVRSQTGELVRLSNLVKVRPGEGPATIERQGRLRQVTVLANLEGIALGPAAKEVEAVAARVVPADLTTSWEGFAEIMGKSFRYMAEAVALAAIMVYLILAAQFESWIHPLTIMLSVPLSVTGALVALWLGGMTINIFSLIGFILLMGLVTKNSILLVDYTNMLRSRGMTRREALEEAGPVRLRPILMTAFATVFAMIPVALGWSQGGEVRAPMAMGVIGGLTVSTLLTLIVIPVVYDLFDAFFERVFGRSLSLQSSEG